MEKPKISINIITYNREQFIVDCIESVLNQSFGDWELIIVDDGSTDGTNKIVSQYVMNDKRIRLLSNESNLGICKSRIRAFDNSQGVFIAILDSDDIWCDRYKLKKQYDFLKNNKEYVLIGGGSVLVDENNVEIKKYFTPSKDTAIRRRLLLKNSFIHSTVMYRRSTSKLVGGYSEKIDDMEINGIEDYELWLKLGVKGKMANISECFVRYRVHLGNVSVQRRHKLMEMSLVLINHYKIFYPFFFLALIRRKFRLYIYQIYKIF